MRSLLDAELRARLLAGTAGHIRRAAVPSFMAVCGIVLPLTFFELLIRLCIAMHLPYFLEPGRYASYLFDDLYWRLYVQSEHKYSAASKERFHPSLGWSQTVISEKNPLGLLDESLRDLQSKSSKILFFGDSFVNGIAPPDCSVPAVIEKELRSRGCSGAQVVHLGVGGYGVDQMLLLYKEIMTVYAPTTVWVIFGILPEDLNRSVLSFRLGAKPRFHLNSSQELSVTLPTYFPSRREEQPYIYLYPRSLLWAVISNRLRLYEKDQKAEVESLNFTLLKAIVSEARDRAQPLSFVRFADQEEVRGEYPMEKFVGESVKALKGDLFEVDSLLKRALDDGSVKDIRTLYAPNDGHMNCSGNTMVGGGIAEWLLQHRAFRDFMDEGA